MNVDPVTGRPCGWSHDSAAGRGKMQDMIEAQRQEWDSKVAHLDACVPLAQLKAFDPGIRGMRRARGVSGAQLKWCLTPNKVLAEVRLPGIAGEIQAVIEHMMALTVSRSRCIVQAVGPQEYVEQVMALSESRRGLCVDLQGNDILEQVTYRFADGSELTGDQNGVR